MCSSKSINDLENQLQVLSKPALSCMALCMDHWLRSLEEPFSPRACTGLLSKLPGSSVHDFSCEVCLSVCLLPLLQFSFCVVSGSLKQWTAFEV